jgi:PKD repeat protein
MQGESSGTLQFTIATQAPGQYELRLILMDAMGNESVPEVIAFVAKGGAGNLPPIAVFSVSPAVVKVGESIIFDASASSDADGSLAGFAWDFGDGAMAYGPQATHVYSTVGTYTVSLTVTDDAGSSDQSTQEIVVQSKTGGSLGNTIEPFSLAIGGAINNNIGVFAVSTSGELYRYYFDSNRNRWEREKVPTAEHRVVAGSLISGEHRVFGVTQGGTVFNARRDGTSIQFHFLLGDGETDIVPGSLALGGEINDNVGVFAVSATGELYRYDFDYGSSRWERKRVPTGTNKIPAGSLISGEHRVYGVTQGGTVFNTWQDKENVRFDFLLGDGETDIVPGSLALGGTPNGSNTEDGVYAVSTTGGLYRYDFDYGSSRWERERVPTGTNQIVAGSLISGEHRVFGVTIAGTVFRAYQERGDVRFELLLGSTETDVAPGSLALGRAQDDPSGEAGVFAVSTSGELYRYYFDSNRNRWEREKVPTAEHRVVAGSLISRELSVYGVTQDGVVFATWQDSWRLGGGSVRFGFLQ